MSSQQEIVFISVDFFGDGKCSRAERAVNKAIKERNENNWRLLRIERNDGLFMLFFEKTASALEVVNGREVRFVPIDGAPGFSHRVFVDGVPVGWIPNGLLPPKAEITADDESKPGFLEIV